jgi:hypothetical protein
MAGHAGYSAEAEHTRRFTDLSDLVRGWVASGAVDADAATRFLLARHDEARRRRASWEAAGRPRRRAEDAPAA